MVKQVAFSSPKITTPRGNFPYGLEGKSMVQKNAWQSLKNRHWMLPTYGWKPILNQGTDADHVSYKAGQPLPGLILQVSSMNPLLF